MQKRKISFNYLSFRNGELSLPVESNLCELLEHLLGKTRVERKQDMSNDKFAFLDSYSLDTSEECHTLRLLFKSAKHSYRAPLLDKVTVEARDNPKTMDEGEQMKTHAFVKFKEGDAILFLETGNNLMTCGNIVEYLNKCLLYYNGQFDDDEEKIKGKFAFEMIPRDDFREMLGNMNRVVCAEIFTDKSILGSDTMNFAEPTEEIKEQIVLTLKAERKKSILDYVYHLVDNFNGTNSKIRRIRIRGKLSNGNESVIDTDFIVKKEYIEAQQDEDTGEYNTPYMFAQLKALANGY